MLSIGRATLPAEFFDTTSRQLLIQPEPQYAHARLIMAAIGMELDAAGGDLGLPGREIPGGPAYGAFADNQLVLDQAFYTDSIKVNTDFVTAPGGMPIGHTIRFNRPRFSDTTYTLASREVSAGTTISTTPINVGSDQVALTIKRFAGPYDSANSNVAPLAISRFDAKRAVHSIAAVREMHLKRDFHKFVDTVGVTLFNSVDSANILYPDGMTAVNDSVAAGDFPFSYALLVKGQRTLDDLSVPLFANGRRIAILTTLQAEQLSRDPEFQRLATFVPPKNPLLVGSYVGTVGQIDVFKSATLSRTANSNSVTIQYGQMFGPGMVGVAPGEMPRVVTSTQDNYGEDPMVIWMFYCAFGVLDARFGVNFRSS